MQKIELKFNSQVCTTIEQSQRLLDLGLKPETADMCYTYKLEHLADTTPEEDWVLKVSLPVGTDIPAWSLHRLIEMCNKIQFGMTIGIHNNEVTIDGELFEVFDNTYDNLISIIEWLIKGGHFKKEYLKQ